MARVTRIRKGDGESDVGDGESRAAVEEIKEPSLNLALANLVNRHIEVVYGGNQSEFARRVDTSTQYVQKLVRGEFGVPREPIRSRLADELGIPRKAFFVLSGDLTQDDIDGPWEARIDARRPMSAVEQRVAERLHDLPPERARLVWELVRVLSGDEDEESRDAT